MKMVQRMKKSRLGKLLCRMFGEERGAVMMEYVIVAVLIAAAAVAAVSYFGKDIVNMFGVAGRAATGDSKGAITDRGAAKGQAEAATKKALEQNTKFSDVEDVGNSQGQGGGNNASATPGT